MVWKAIFLPPRRIVYSLALWLNAWEDEKGKALWVTGRRGGLKTPAIVLK